MESESLITIEEVLPSITYVSYKSDFSDTTLATVANQITVTIKTDEVIQEPSVIIFGNSTNINFEGGNKWSSTYTLEQDPEEWCFFKLMIYWT